MIPAPAASLLQSRARSIAGVLVLATVLLGLHGLVASGEGRNVRFPAAIEDAVPGDRASGRIWFPIPAASYRRHDPRVIRSLLDIRKPMAFGDFVWDDAGVPAGAMWVRIDLRRQVLSVFRGGHEIATAVIIYGAQNKRSPLGQFKVLAKDKDYHSATYDAGMPFAMFLTRDGVAIHAADVRLRNATHGCTGVPIEFAQRLYAALKVGDPVDIVETMR